MSEFKTTSIKFTSRASMQLTNPKTKNTSYYTFEATIEKSVPDDCTKNEYEEAKRQLWEECNAEVDNQLLETVEYLKNVK